VTPAVCRNSGKSEFVPIPLHRQSSFHIAQNMWFFTLALTNFIDRTFYRFPDSH